MSVDIIARALAQPLTPVTATAVAISSLRLATSVGIIQTSGYDVSGVGAGDYVVDALATLALATAHPRFCKADGSSPTRYWRLIGSSVQFEQGGASSAAGFDNRSAIQAAINYARAVGIRRVEPASDGQTYELWAPTLSLANTNLPFDRDGPTNFLTISADLTLWGRGATFNCKAWNGGSLQTVTQAITGNAAWRGNGINVLGGTAASPALYAVGKVSLHDLTVDGGCDRVRGASSAAELASSDYLSHKGFRVQDTQVGELYFENVTFRRFRGEVIYLAAAAGLGREAYGHPRTSLINCRAYGSNQCALNPNSGRLTVIGGEYGDAPIAMEAIGGAGHTFIGTRFYDAWQIGLFGGAGYNGFSTCLYAGMTDTGAEDLPPWTVFSDVSMEFCRDLQLNALVRGSLKLVDTYPTISSIAAGQARGFDLDIDVMTHKVSVSAALTLQGPANATTTWGNGTGGFIQPIKNGNIRLSHRRSAYAKANSITAGYAVAFAGLIEQDTVAVQVSASEATAVSGPLAASDANAKAMPRIDVTTGLGVSVGAGEPLGGRSVSFGTGGVTTPAYTLNVHSSNMLLTHNGLAGTTTIALGVPYTAPYDYAFGQRIRIEFSAYSTAGTVMLFPKAGTGLRLLKDRRLIQRGDWLELEWNAYSAKWQEVAFSSSTEGNDGARVLVAGEASTSVTPALIADTGGDWTIPVVAGYRYQIRMYGKYTTAAATTGCILNMTAVASAAGTLVGTARGAISDVAAATELSRPIVALPWSLTTIDLPASGTGFVGFECVFVCSASGNLEVRWGTEVAASTATLLADSALVWSEL